MLNKVSEHLQAIQKKLPTWFKMRRDKESMGARFLNVMGLSLDDVIEILDYAHYQQFLPTADLDQVDLIYKASIPSTITTDTILDFSSEYYDLQKAATLEQFYTTLQTDRLNHKEIFHDHPYYIDFKRSMVYVRKPYDKNEAFPEGSIKLRIYDANGAVILAERLKLSLHHVWNFFDEFGLLLDTPRLYGETNREYKQRILNVFRRPANSSEDGLYNGIARELGLIKQVAWKNGGEDLMLRDPRVKPDSIMVDGEPFLEELTLRDESGRLILTADMAYEGVERTVSYLSGITMHQLHDKRDTAFQNELFDIDGRGTAVLQYYVDIINSRVPIMWDNFVWGLGFWDVATPELSGYGMIPTFYDADISGWKRYRP
jgi:hypothetical protein